MRKFAIAAVLLATTFGVLRAQCLQVQSILVDACVPGGGCTNSQSLNCSCEGKNEMVLFGVGATALNTTSLTATWPNNTFRGWAQNATTASHVATLNSTIVSCGFLKEPVNDTLPANAQVLIITSWDMCTGANSFTNLQDTLFVLFQDTANFQGHFANHNNGGTINTVPSGTVSLRSMTLSYAPLSCSQTVTYDRSQLVNIYGTYGGTVAENDGSTVLFDALGNASYVNNGCQAPYIPLQVDAGAGGSVCFNDTAMLTGSLSGPYTSFSWSGGAGTFSNASSDTTMYFPGASDSGVVTLYLTAQGKCSGGIVDSVQLTITGAPAPLIAAGSNPACSGSVVVLSVTPETGTSYTWSPGSTTGATYGFIASSTTVYTVTASNSCATASDTMLLTVNPSPTIAVVNDTICPGSTGTLTASGANTYTWSTNATGPTLTVSLTATTQFTVVGSDTNGCINGAVGQIVVSPLPVISVNSPSVCPGATATLTASGAASYTWSTSQTGSSISVSPTVTTGYTVKGEDSNGCANTVAAVVTVYTPPPVAANSAGVCPGGTATLTAAGANTYTWSTSQTGNTITVSPSGATSYTVTGTDNNGCVNASVATVTINPLPVISVGTASTCPGATTTLGASGASTYTWSTAQTGASISVPGVAATYTVAGTDTNGCSSTATGSVVLLPLPPPQNVFGQAIICDGQSDTLYVTDTTYTYSWTGPSGALGTGTAVAVTEAGVYTVTAMNGCGGTQSEFTVTVSSPDASFSPNAGSAPVPATFVFTNTSQGAGLVNYWNLGNGDTSSAIHASATYTLDGSYAVTLVITDQYGCMDTATLILLVTDTAPPIVIPNIFSPNGDNVNDLFTISGKNVTSFNCKVYDRWGLLLYEWSDINSGWDGRNAATAKPVSDGTYYILVSYTDKTGKSTVRPAYIQLVH